MSEGICWIFVDTEHEVTSEGWFSDASSAWDDVNIRRKAFVCITGGSAGSSETRKGAWTTFGMVGGL